MKILKLMDLYNENKIWVVKIYSKGEVYYNQEICEKVNSKYQRTTKKWLNEILERDINTIIENDSIEDLPEEYLSREDGTLHIISNRNRENEFKAAIDTEALPF